MTTIALCMIVRDEAHVIERCLESARPLVDFVLVCDTGSTDGTPETIRRWLEKRDMPGEVFTEEWRDFAYNRSFVLNVLRHRSEIDYAIMLDADDVLAFDDLNIADFKANLRHAVYSLEIRLGGIVYRRPQLTSNRYYEFRYRGVVHEFLDTGPFFVPHPASGLHIRAGTNGARSRDPNKYRRDAQLIERELADPHCTDPLMRSRYTFYLAQSWRDCGEISLALDAYMRRADMEGWAEEVYVALLNAARLMAVQGWQSDTVIATFLRAFEVCPGRAEALHGAALHCRIMGRWAQAEMFSFHATSRHAPKDGLFVEPWIYHYGALDEFSLASFGIGRLDVAISVAENLLQDHVLPDAERPRVEANLAEFKQQRPEAAQ